MKLLFLVVCVASCASHPIRLQDSLIINYLWKESIYPLVFFACRQSARESSMWDYLIWLCVASYAFRPIKLQDSLIINIFGKNQLIPLSDQCQSFLLNMVPAGPAFLFFPSCFFFFLFFLFFIFSVFLFFYLVFDCLCCFFDISQQQFFFWISEILLKI